MTNSKRDENRVPVLMAASRTDGTPTLVKATAGGRLKVDPSSTSTVTLTDAIRDENYVTSIIAVSSTDGETPVVVYADPSTGALFIQT